MCPPSVCNTAPPAIAPVETDDVLGFNVSAARLHVQIEIPRNAHFHGHPQTPARVAPQTLPAKIHALGRGIGRDDVIFQELLRVFLRGVCFQANFVINLPGILRLDNDVAQIRNQVQPLPVACRNAARQLRANPRPAMILPLGFRFIRPVRRSRPRHQQRGRQKRATDARR
jgi:hypothetical protein